MAKKRTKNKSLSVRAGAVNKSIRYRNDWYIDLEQAFKDDKQTYIQALSTRVHELTGMMDLCRTLGKCGIKIPERILEYIDGEHERLDNVKDKAIKLFNRPPRKLKPSPQRLRELNKRLDEAKTVDEFSKLSTEISKLVEPHNTRLRVKYIVRSQEAFPALKAVRDWMNSDDKPEARPH